MLDLSYQLYSARNHPPLADHLRLLASLGYKQVEGYGGLYADTDLGAFRRQLDDLGLAMSTAHIGLDDLRDTDATRRIAESLGIEMVFCPAIGPEQRRMGDDGWIALAEELEGLARTYADSGIGFGWHNHDFEFAATPSGTLPLDILLGGSDLKWEADLAWISRGGQDPSAWIDKYADRLVAAHIKDIAPEGEALDEEGWADVGHGVLPWGALLDQLTTKTDCKYFVMEHDKPSDAARFARRSIEAVRALGF